jgi:hypothetical protein
MQHGLTVVSRDDHFDETAHLTRFRPLVAQASPRAGHVAPIACRRFFDLSPLTDHAQTVWKWLKTQRLSSFPTPLST